MPAGVGIREAAGSPAMEMPRAAGSPMTGWVRPHPTADPHARLRAVVDPMVDTSLAGAFAQSAHGSSA